MKKILFNLIVSWKVYQTRKQLKKRLTSNIVRLWLVGRKYDRGILLDDTKIVSIITLGTKRKLERQVVDLGKEIELLQKENNALWNQLN